MTDQELSDEIQEHVYAMILVDIIANSNTPIVIYTNQINDLCMDLCALTGTMVIPKRLIDSWDVESPYGNTYTRTRVNNRKNQLTIKS